LKPGNYSPITNRNADEIIAHAIDGEVNVGEFIERASALAAQLPGHQYVFNLLTDRYQYLLGFCASVIAGQCTLMPPNRLAGTLEKLAKTYPDSYTLDEALLTEQTIRQLDESSISQQSKQIEVPQISADQLCAIAFTSGSTGEPSPNLKYWRTIRDSSLANAKLLLADVSGQLNLLATVPPQHMWGFETSILLPLFANVAVCHRTPFYPQDIADALESLPGQRALVSSPVHLDALVRSEVKPVKVKRIFSATAPMSGTLAEKLENLFGALLVEVFGSSESGILARRHTASESLWQKSPIFEFRVCKDRIYVNAKHLPCEIELCDHLEIVDSNHFNWLGRHQDMINIAGKRGSLADLNRCLLDIEGVVDGVVFLPKGGQGRLAAMVVAPNMSVAEINQSLKKRVEPVFLPRPVYMVSALPRLETGKLSREDIMGQYENLAK
jgi:acyl-coenzyme A synthetase/AMP-(fatty) acid ligase